MHEYVDAAHNVRGNLLSVPSDSDSPAWHIKPHAGDGSYYEHHHTVAGAGVLDIWFHGNNWLTIGRQYPLPEQPGISPTLIVKDGDTFQVRAGKLGLHVFALFLEAPFQDEYEERVAVPSVRLQAKV
jgi:hypothetical protein